MRGDPPPAEPGTRRGGDPDALGDLFWGVASRLRRQSRDSLAPRGINPSHSRALTVLARHGPARLSTLSEHLHIAPRSTTEVVDALEQRGLVERSADPSDRRATVVSLTDAGRHMVTAVQAARKDEAERFFGALSAQDRATLTRILRTLQPD